MIRLLPFLLLCSCSTRVYENGLPVLATYSNADYLKFHSPRGSELEMVKLDNSTPTRVGLDGITKLGTAIGTAILSRGVSTVIPVKK